MKILQILIIVFVLSHFVNAQEAVLSGTISDDVGALLPNTKIELTDETGRKFSTLTDDVGDYKIKINEGIYRIEVKLFPFKKFVISEYRIVLYGKMQLDIALICPAECQKEKSH